MDTVSKIIDFLKNLLDLLLGKSSGPPVVNPDNGQAATTEEHKVDTVTNEIKTDPDQGVSTTPDGGINYDKESKK